MLPRVHLAAVLGDDLRVLAVVLEFDPASFVPTAMGRINGGSARGDGALARRYCDPCFRI